jgi:signal transduction histidine kinase
MTFFLLGLFCVGVLWIFEIWQTVSIAAITLLIFSIGLHHFQEDVNVFKANYIVACCVLFWFFVLSRISFSYHYNYFLQLKTIENKNNEISKINHIQTEILGVVAHDLRGPINNVVSLIDLVKNHAPTEEEKQQYYALILDVCNEADHIIHDLIDVATHAENTTIPTNEISLNTFLSSFVEHWQYVLPKGRALTFAPPDKDIIAAVNEQRMFRVLDNLVNNAIKFTHNGGKILIELKVYHNRARISITDNGIGIPQNILPYLFERFSKTGRQGNSGEKSYGLGLTICRQIVEQHNGLISAESKEGEGATFHIDLPIVG